MSTKTKAIDLGLLQDNLIATRHLLDQDTKALERAQLAFDKSKSDCFNALEALKNAIRVVME
jgi:hypothetical protein